MPTAAMIPASLVIPVFRNEESLAGLLAELRELYTDLERQLSVRLEIVFVNDGSDDHSIEILQRELKSQPYVSSLLLLSRNFGSFAALRTGMLHCRGNYIATRSADIQEPNELYLSFFQKLMSDEYDIAFGARIARDDALLNKFASLLYWKLYRRFIQSQMPSGGVDVFACNKKALECLLSLNENNSSLVGLAIWMGFRRTTVFYHRRRSIKGKSSWSFSKKWRYATDSIFAFSDLPIRLLTWLGSMGLVAAMTLLLWIIAAKYLQTISVPGYAATMVVILAFGGLNMLALGILGGYVWRTFENTKQRPSAIVGRVIQFSGSADDTTDKNVKAHNN